MLVLTATWCSWLSVNKNNNQLRNHCFLVYFRIFFFKLKFEHSVYMFIYCFTYTIVSAKKDMHCLSQRTYKNLRYLHNIICFVFPNLYLCIVCLLYHFVSVNELTCNTSTNLNQDTVATYRFHIIHTNPNAT